VDVSQRAKQLMPSAIAETGDAARTSDVRSVAEVIDLAEGDPNFATPSAIVEGAVDGLRLGLTHYSSARGLGTLRRAILEGQAEFRDAGYEAESNIVITPGAKFALYAALMCLVDPGDNVMVLDPSWVSYDQMIRLAGGVPVHVPSTSADHFFPVAYERTVHSIPAKVWILNSPHNPTGRVYREAELRILLNWATADGAYVIADEIYKDITYDVPHCSVATFPEFRDRVLVVGGFSKTFAMTGWRLGYVVGPSSVLDKVAQFQQHTATCAAPFIQHAAEATTKSRAVRRGVDVMLADYRHRRAAVEEVLSGVAGLEVAPMEGTFYAWVAVSRLGITSAEFARRLLREHGVAVVAGLAFGECGNGWIRLCYGRQDLDTLRRALERFGEFVARLVA